MWGENQFSLTFVLPCLSHVSPSFIPYCPIPLLTFFLFFFLDLSFSYKKENIWIGSTNGIINHARRWINLCLPLTGLWFGVVLGGRGEGLLPPRRSCPVQELQRTSGSSHHFQGHHWPVGRGGGPIAHWAPCFLQHQESVLRIALVSQSSCYFWWLGLASL